MRLHFVAIAAALLLTGCASPPQESASLSTTTAATQALDALALPILNASSSVEAPVWAERDAWRIASYDADGATADGWLVVSAASGDSYTIATDLERTAMYDATFDVSYVGKIRARDLAGSQRDSPIQFFDFPLRDGKTWSTTWDRTTVNLTATFSPRIDTPLGGQPGFLVSGEARGQPYVEYDYVPALGWWSRLAFADEYGFTVKAVAHDWTGEVVIGSSKLLLTLATAAPIAETPGGTFTVDAGQTTLMVTLVGRTPEAYARGLKLIDPNHQPQTPSGFADYEMEAEGTSDFDAGFLPPTAGQWHVVAPSFHDKDGAFTLTVMQVALEKRAL